MTKQPRDWNDPAYDPFSDIIPVGGHDPFADIIPLAETNVVRFERSLGMDDVPRPPLSAYEADAVQAPGQQHQAIIPKAERASRFYSAATLAGRAVPERKWLVPDLIPARTVTLLYGDGGTGKSLLALQLAVAVATGQRWLGRETQGGQCVFLSAEDEADELHRRLSDILAHEGADFAGLDRLTLRSMAGEDALLAQIEGPHKPLLPTPLCEEIDALLADLKPALLVLDTLADLFPGNENDKAQVRQFVGILKGLAIRHDCAVVTLAHPSMSGMASGTGTSGNVAWGNSARSRLYFKRIEEAGQEDNPDARVLTTKKVNYGRSGSETMVTWRDGVFVLDAREAGLDRVARNAVAERVFLSLVRLWTIQGRPPNPTMAPANFAASSESEGIRKAAFTQARDALLAQGKLKIVRSGPDTRPLQRLEIVG
ncbi:MAG: AAA family ATPase [Pseudomonadota bacterium]